MAVLFLSHSSLNDRDADALTDWLSAHGFNDVFVDHHDIRGGASWGEALRRSAGACRVILCLVTQNWLNSANCFNEFLSAWYMGKRIVPLFATGPAEMLTAEARQRLQEVKNEYQGLDISRCISASGEIDLSRDPNTEELLSSGLRAAGALSDIGLDPGAFDVDPEFRPIPFLGLSSFSDEDADAALFYGRSAEIAGVIEELRTMRVNADRRPLVLLGASGAGKSSLLRAGVIPRLRREAPGWAPMRAFRPGMDPLQNFADAMAKSFADFGAEDAPGVIRQRLFSAWSAADRADGALTAAGRKQLETALEVEGTRLRRAADRPRATILVSIDQAEELLVANGDAAEALADYLRAALEAEAEWRLAFTIRTDSFRELQSHSLFEGLEARGYDLRSVPVFRFDNLIEEPAKRYGVDIDPALVRQLVADAPKSDALPLLSFALERLWTQFAAKGSLTLEDYTSLGGLSKLITTASEAALAGLGPSADLEASPARPTERDVELGEKTFVPALASINAEGAPVRRVAALSELPVEGRRILQQFERWRLIVRKADDADPTRSTVEVAHEAIFREWWRLKKWLEPERQRLAALRGLTGAADAWDHGERNPSLLIHFDDRLREVRALQKNPRYADLINQKETEYLAAALTKARGMTRRRVIRRAVTALLFGTTVLGAVGYYFEAELKREWARVMDFQPYQLDSAAIAALEPGAIFSECSGDVACPELVVIPAGRFIMGNRGDGAQAEKPHRRVTIERFAAGRFEVTHDEWEYCVDLTQKRRQQTRDADGAPIGCEPVSDRGFGRGDRPVINVTWAQAKGYVRFLNYMSAGSAEEGPYRLLSEAEWEYAARAGARRGAYSWGDATDEACVFGNVANAKTKVKYDFTYDAFACDDGYIETAPVGSFFPNSFGLYDMHGNVQEWVADCWHGWYNGAPTDQSVWGPEDGGDCDHGPVRGGSWVNSPENTRSAHRARAERSTRDGTFGFRIARSLPAE